VGPGWALTPTQRVRSLLSSARGALQLAVDGPPWRPRSGFRRPPTGGLATQGHTRPVFPQALRLTSARTGRLGGGPGSKPPRRAACGRLRQGWRRWPGPPRCLVTGGWAPIGHLALGRPRPPNSRAGADHSSRAVEERPPRAFLPPASHSDRSARCPSTKGVRRSPASRRSVSTAGR